MFVLFSLGYFLAFIDCFCLVVVFGLFSYNLLEVNPAEVGPVLEV